MGVYYLDHHTLHSQEHLQEAGLKAEQPGLKLTLYYYEIQALQVTTLICCNTAPMSTLQPV